MRKAWRRRARSRRPSRSAGSRRSGTASRWSPGLPNARLDELLRFDKGQFGFAQVLERDRVGCVLLDDVDAIEAGDTVRGTGDVVRVPVGPALLGRIVDPLGRPLDGKGPDRSRDAANRSSARRPRSSIATS